MLKRTPSKFAFVVVLLLGLGSISCVTHQPMHKSATTMVKQATPAISGYDPVAYFTMNKAVRGSGMHTAQHAGSTFMFSSAKNKALFASNPSRYLPEFDGYCAFGAAMGKKFYTDPTIFGIVNNKLYLNLNKDIQKKWNADQKNMIRKGHANWAKM